MQNVTTVNISTCFLFFLFGGVEPSRLLLRPLLAYCISTWWWMMMSVEQSVEWLTRETEILGEYLPQWSFVHHKSHMTWPMLKPGPPHFTVLLIAQSVRKIYFWDAKSFPPNKIIPWTLQDVYVYFRVYKSQIQLHTWGSKIHSYIVIFKMPRCLLIGFWGWNVTCILIL
jgi:hypothetical protein